MDIETITKLIDAGYTKEEIEKLQSGGDASAVQTPNENGSGSTEPEEPKEQSTPNQAHDSKVTEDMLKTLTDTVAGLQETVKALQQQNAKNADSKGTKPADPIKDTIDSFINTL